MQDGHLNKCKNCTKKDVRDRENNLKESVPEWTEKERIRHRRKYHRLGYKEKHKPTREKKSEIITRYMDKYPEKERCKYIVNLKSEKPPKGYHRHHWCYRENFALDIILLTIREHHKAHIYLIYDQERMMYRRSDNNELLNTKEKHLKYIKHCIDNNPD